MRILSHIFCFNIIFIILLSIFGCADDEQWEDQKTSPVVNPSWFYALDYPTADGNSWQYIRSDKRYSYTSKVIGTKNISGSTVRMLVSNSDIPVDYTGALYGVPVRNYMFTKDIDQYKEYAFDLWIESWNNTYFQRYLPERIVWSFPFYKDKEWVVNKLYTEPRFTYIRKVVADNERISVPAGDYTQVFVVEESVFTETQQNLGVISTYWLVKGVGIIKYQYTDFSLLLDVTYELGKFSGNL